MTWPKAKEDFETALKLARKDAEFLKSSNPDALFTGDSPSKGVKRFKKLRNAEQFLSSLEELKGFYRNVDEKIFTDLLEATAFAIRHPDSKYRQNLLTACENFAYMIEKKSDSAKNTAKADVEIDTGYSSVALIGAAIIATAVAIAITAGGPFALLGVAVAGLLCALVIHAFAEDNIDKNRQFLGDKQYNFMSEFVSGLLDDTEDLDSDVSLNPTGG